jgi:hypothetical protein
MLLEGYNYYCCAHAGAPDVLVPFTLRNPCLQEDVQRNAALFDALSNRNNSGRIPTDSLREHSEEFGMDKITIIILDRMSGGS